MKFLIVSPKPRLHASRDDNAIPVASGNRFPGPPLLASRLFRCSVPATSSGFGYFAATKLLSANVRRAGFALLKIIFPHRARRSGTLAKRALLWQHDLAT